MPTVFVSDAIDAERVAFSARPAHLAPAWKALSALYQASLAACGWSVRPVLRPEIYQSAQARNVLGVGEEDWHLAVKPIEHVRPFHGIPNVSMCNWPFAELSSSSYDVSPFLDHRRQLSHAALVLAASDAVANNLRRAVVSPVIVLPPHLPSAVPVSPANASQSLSFLTAPGMALSCIVTGFLQAWSCRPEMRLTISVADGADAAAALRQNLARSIGKSPGGELLPDAVSVVSGALSDHLASANFFLASDPPEMFSLSLATAMRAGVPLIAAVRQAEERSFTLPLQTRRVTADPAVEALASHMPLTWEQVQPSSVCESVLAAAALTLEARSSMHIAAREEAERRFGLAAFAAGLSRVVETIRQ